MNKLSQTSNIRINPNGARVLTNNQGEATLTLQIISGVPGNYSIVVSGGEDAQSPPSNAISFTNTINAVEYTNALAQSHEIQAQTDSN